eukprot:TRINITY_DN11367_c0_g2_i2.p1 TRINITY_DN11367_c0_g2~~TRINITY_DN11367_c0_g2_i2.p1  ORF type:complete len:777 (-),score=163.48 TRINITY_DN11367_c0_g2_i2:195-2432(-)
MEAAASGDAPEPPPPPPPPGPPPAALRELAPLIAQPPPPPGAPRGPIALAAEPRRALEVRPCAYEDVRLLEAERSRAEAAVATPPRAAVRPCDFSDFRLGPQEFDERSLSRVPERLSSWASQATSADIGDRDRDRNVAGAWSSSASWSSSSWSSTSSRAPRSRGSWWGDDWRGGWRDGRWQDDSWRGCQHCQCCRCARRWDGGGSWEDDRTSFSGASSDRERWTSSSNLRNSATARIRSTGDGEFGSSLAVRAGLLDIQLQSCGLDDAAAERWCTFADESLPALIQRLPDRTELEVFRACRAVACEVNLADNCLGDRGLLSILRLLHRHGVGVRVFKLFKNSLGYAAAQTLADWISTSPAPLWELHLSHNFITIEGAFAILEAVARNPTYPPQRQPLTEPTPLWLRFEHNVIDDPVAFSSDAEARMRAARRHTELPNACGIAETLVCFVRNEDVGCKSHRCQRTVNGEGCPLVHLTYTERQRGFQESVPAAASAWDFRQPRHEELDRWRVGGAKDGSDCDDTPPPSAWGDGAAAAAAAVSPPPPPPPPPPPVAAQQGAAADGPFSAEASESLAPSPLPAAPAATLVFEAGEPPAPPPPVQEVATQPLPPRPEPCSAVVQWQPPRQPQDCVRRRRRAPRPDGARRDVEGVGGLRLLGNLKTWQRGKDGGFGWIVPDRAIEHPAARRHRGEIFVSAADVTPGLLAGVRVEFRLYADDNGLGAAECCPAFSSCEGTLPITSGVREAWW